MAAVRTIESITELKTLVGKEISVCPWMEVTQERVNAFADATDDHQWIHVDTDRAASSPFGGTIAHGFLTLSLMIMMGKDVEEGAQIKLPAVMGVNYGLNRVRFVSPVVVGTSIRLRTTLADVTDISPDVYQLTYAQTVEIEGSEKPAMVAEWVTRQYLQPGS